MGGGKNTIDESYITFGGGKSWSSGLSAIDAAMSSFHNANRLAFANPDGITIEYSKVGGETWLDYGATDTEKVRLVTDTPDRQPIVIGKLGTSSTAEDNQATLNDMLRITLSASDMGIYVHLAKLLIEITSNGASGCKCRIERSLNSDPTSFTLVGEYSISGWSGWNSIPLPHINWGSNSFPSNWHSIRLIFSIGALSDTYNSNLTVKKILLYAPTSYSTNSSLAETGHLYRISASKDAVFPAGVRAGDGTGTFTGSNFTGLAAKATADANGNNIASTYVRLDGQSTMTDSLKVNCSSYPQFYLTSNQNSEWYNGRIMVGNKNVVMELRQSESDSNKIGISLFGNNSLEKQLQFHKVVDDVSTYYNIYGTHNLTCGTADLTAGTSALNTSCIYLVYE